MTSKQLPHSWEGGGAGQLLSDTDGDSVSLSVLNNSVQVIFSQSKLSITVAVILVFVYLYSPGQESGLGA